MNAGTGSSLRILVALTVFSLLVSGNCLMAQRGGGRGGGRMDPEQMRERMKERAEEQYKKMCETLVLDEQQQQAADSLHAITVQERDKQFAEFKEKRDPRQSMDKLKTVQDNFFTEFEKILNDEQKERLELIKKEMQEQMQERRSQRRR